jgi:hypothetical protein
MRQRTSRIVMGATQISTGTVEAMDSAAADYRNSGKP